MVLITESPCGSEMDAQRLARPADMQAPKCASHEQASESRSSAARGGPALIQAVIREPSPGALCTLVVIFYIFYQVILIPKAATPGNYYLSLVAQIRKQVRRG